ncbi:MAG: Gfo/Idh/MocA family oxidoreductase [Spirochaetales bacterium]|nr:Gfo/Idh/MocA family oxidoreductase [Spirochaetales bacterium]
MRIPVACIGLGRIAYGLEADPYRYHPCTHLGSILARRSFLLTRAYDYDQGQCSKFARWWQKKVRQNAPVIFDRGTAFLESMRKDPPQACIIATPPASHVELAMAVLDLGVKQIILEKPVSTNLKDAQQLLTIARKKKAQIRVNFERRYHNGYRKIKSLLATEKLGALRSIQGKVLRGPIRQGEGPDREGPLLHDAIHWLDLLVNYVGTPRNLSFRRLDLPGARPPLEHTVFLRLDYAEFTATLESGGRRRYFTFEMELDFERGRLRAGNTGFEMYVSRSSRRYAKFFELQRIPLPFRLNNPWLELYRELELACRGKPAALTSSLESSLESLAMVDQVYG